MSGGGKKQTSTSKVTIPPEVMAQYKKSTDMASAAANTPWQAYSSDPSAFVAGMTPTQMAGMGNINANAQAAQPWYQGAGGATIAGMGGADLGGLNVDQYISPYLRNVAQTTSDLLGQQNEQAMSGQLGNAITSGAAWGDRSGIAAANLNRQQTMSSANILSNLLNQGYTQAQGVAQQQQGADLAARQANLARLMQGGMNLGQLGTGAQTAALQGGQSQMEAGRQQQQTDQAGLSALYNQWLQQKAYPFQTAKFFSDIATGIGANSGSTTSLTQPAGFFSGLARGGRAGKAYGGGLGEASMGGHVGMEHAMQGFADGGAPQDYSAMVLQELFGGTNPNAGAYGMAGGLPGGGSGFVPQYNTQSAVLKPAEMPEPTDRTSAKDVVSAVEKGADIYNSEGAEKAGSFIKKLLGYDNPMQQASGGRAGYGLGGMPYESSATGSTGGFPSPGGGYVPPPVDDQSSDKLKPTEIAPQEQESGLGKIADIAKIATMFFLKDGGVAGPRHGYDAGGAPTEKSWLEWLSETFPASGPAAGTPPTPPPSPSSAPAETPAAAPAAPAPPADLGTPPTAASSEYYPGQGTVSDALLGIQKSAADAVEKTLDVASDPNAPWGQRGLAGLATIPGYMGVYGTGALNKIVGDPTAGDVFWPRDPNATPASAPSAPEPGLASAETPAAAPVEQRRIPQVFGETGMSYTPPLPKPGLAAAAEPAAAGAGPGPAFERTGRGAPGLAAATSISPVTQMTGTPVGDRTGLELYQFNAANDEGTNKINFGDPNGGTLAGFHLGQYKSIDPSIRSLGDVQPHHIRDAQAKWWRENGGDAIQAEYGPEFAASYVNLSMLNPNMAKAALAQAGGDKAGFFDIMGQKLANLGQNPKYAPNVKGWLGRVDRNKRFALSEGSTEMPAGRQTAAMSSDESPALALAGADISAPATSNVPQIRQAAGEVGGDTGRGIGGIGNWFRKNENALLPILSGIGAMASSPSRYLGSAILQGVGAGAGSYMKRQGQLADIAQTQALTRGVDIANAKASYQALPNGAAIMWTVQNGQAVPMNAADYFRAQRAGNVIQTLGYVPGQTGGGQPAGAPSIGGGESSGVATVQAPQIPMPAGINFGDKSRAAAENETAIANPLAGGPAYETAKKQAETYTSGVQLKAETARRTEQLTNEMATNLANAIIEGGASTAGAGFDVRAQAVGILNTALRMFNVPVEEVSNADTVSTINKKITTLFGAMSAAGVDQTSFAAFSELANAIPNPNMPPSAIASLVASMMVQSARSKAQEYHQRQYGSYSGGLYGGASAAFNEENPVSNDIQAKDTIAKFMLEAPDLFKHALEGRLTPQQIDEAFEKGYGIPGMSRFFNRGT